MVFWFEIHFIVRRESPEQHALGDEVYCVRDGVLDFFLLVFVCLDSEKVHPSEKEGGHARESLGLDGVEDSCTHSLIKDCVQNLALLVADSAPDAVYAPDIAYKDCEEGVVACGQLHDRLEPAAQSEPELVLRWQGRVGDLLQLQDDGVALALYDSIVYLAFVFEVGVDGAPAFVGSGCYVVHRGVLNTFMGEQLTGYFYEFFSCLEYHPVYCTVLCGSLHSVAICVRNYSKILN